MGQMEPKVFLHYTQAELDRNFDQRGWAKNALEVIERYKRRSAETRAAFEHRANVAYGAGPDEILDIFPARRAGAPIQIFVHGGAWRHFTKDDYSFPASVFVPEGIHTVIVNFTKLPHARLPEIVAQVRRAIEWVHRNAAGFGGDPERIFLSAQSSGAHLSSLALATDWQARGVPNDVIKAATCVSGPYDLEPVMLSARRAYVELTPDEVGEMSPVRHANSVKCPVTLVFAEHDTDEFQRQTKAFAAALERAGKLNGLVRIPGVNHFELMEDFGDRNSLLVRTILDRMAASLAQA
jgi:arylformamidase